MRPVARRIAAIEIQAGTVSSDDMPYGGADLPPNTAPITPRQFRALLKEVGSKGRPKPASVVSAPPAQPPELEAE